MENSGLIIKNIIESSKTVTNVGANPNSATVDNESILSLDVLSDDHSYEDINVPILAANTDAHMSVTDNHSVLGLDDIFNDENADATNHIIEVDPNVVFPDNYSILSFGDLFNDDSLEEMSDDGDYDMEHPTENVSTPERILSSGKGKETGITSKTIQNLDNVINQENEYCRDLSAASLTTSIERAMNKLKRSSTVKTTSSTNSTSGKSNFSLFSPEEKILSGKNFDLSSSLVSFSHKAPLPPTASSMRTGVDNSDTISITSNFINRRKLSPVQGNATVATWDEDEEEIISPTSHKLEPISQGNRGSIRSNNALENLGAMPKQKSFNESFAIRRKSIHKLSSLRNQPAEGNGLQSTQPLSSTAPRVMPNSANIRELNNRRDVIRRDHFVRLSRQKLFLNDEEQIEEIEKDDELGDFSSGLSSTSIKLPLLVENNSGSRTSSGRPRTPPAMAVSTLAPTSLSKVKFGDESVLMMEFKKGAFTSANNRKVSTNTNDSGKFTDSDFSGKDKERTKNIRKVELYSCLGNLMYDAEKKRIVNSDIMLKHSVPSDSKNEYHNLSESTKRFCRRLLYSVQASIQFEIGKIYNKILEKNRIHEDTMQTVFEHDVGFWAKKISSDILNNVMDEEKDKTRHNPVKTISTPVKILSTTKKETVTHAKAFPTHYRAIPTPTKKSPTPVKKINSVRLFSGAKLGAMTRKGLERTVNKSIPLPDFSDISEITLNRKISIPSSHSTVDSGFESSNHSEATQTSKIATPRQAEATNIIDMSDIAQTLEQLNVKLVTGRPVYKRLVDKEKKVLKKKAHLDNWRRRSLITIKK